MNDYNIIIPAWLVVSFVTLLLFRIIPKKMKEVSDPQTKNSLFTILIFTGMPLLLAAVLTPLIFIIGDKDMEDTYKFVWIGLCLMYVVYFFVKQRSEN